MKTTNQDQQHLDLLAIFHFIAGGLTALVSCVFLIHVAMGIAFLFLPVEEGEAPPQVFALIFILVPSLLILAGWTLGGLIIAAGRRLKQRRCYTFCLVMAAVECVLMPFGTVLGVFTIIVLVRESVKKLFLGREGAGQDLEGSQDRMEEPEPRPLALVKVADWYKADLREKGVEGSPLLDEEVFVYMGEIPNMPEHCVVAGQASGRVLSGYHTENFVELAEGET